MEQYVKHPNLPVQRITKAITDCRISEEAVKSLQALGIDCLFSKKIDSLYNAVSAHPDMQICHCGGNRFIAAKEVYDYYKSLLPHSEIICGTKKIESKYPQDVLYNCAVFGNNLIGNLKYLAPEVMTAFHNTRHINVSQGYSKCSVAVISKNAIITSDDGIYRSVPDDIDVLKIQSGFITLEGLDYGFIGGSCGMINQNELALNGELATHPDGKIIKSFCKNHGVDIIELKQGSITDIGSILPVIN